MSSENRGQNLQGRPRLWHSVEGLRFNPRPGGSLGWFSAERLISHASQRPRLSWKPRGLEGRAKRRPKALHEPAGNHLRHFRSGHHWGHQRSSKVIFNYNYGPLVRPYTQLKYSIHAKHLGVMSFWHHSRCMRRVPLPSIVSSRAMDKEPLSMAGLRSRWVSRWLRLRLRNRLRPYMG